ncbi:MAG: ribonuclease E/G [Proteobacteria bacterium]|nr:ribonuclease E/G [Pseudomonadota bacterium]
MVSEIADILIETSPAETRAALMAEDGRLVRFFIERSHRKSLRDGIYSGRVSAIDKVSNGAFVDIGVQAAAFLPRAKGLTEGEALVVQVVRNAWAEKGPVVTKTPVLYGRYVNLQPGGKGVQVERGVAKSRPAKELEESFDDNPAGRITIRRSALSVSRAVLDDELQRLQAQWEQALVAAKSAKASACLLPAPGLADRLLRDQSPTEEIYVDDRGVFMALKKLVNDRYGDLKGRIAFHGHETRLFEEAEVEDQLAASLERIVTLKGGGRLVIDETEALVAIDVDSGRVGGGPDGIRRANMDAMGAIAEQILLRNLAGLIVIDPISMSNRGHRKQIVEALRQAMKGDDRSVDVLGMTPAGLIEMTRQRSGPTLAEQMLLGRQPSVSLDAESEAAAVLRKALALKGPGRPVITATPDIVACLEGPLQDAVAETNRRLGQSLEIRANAAKYAPELSLER